jgi:pimeloyl-ACP methyl ester carboxylesterase
VTILNVIGLVGFALCLTALCPQLRYALIYFGWSLIRLHRYQHNCGYVRCGDATIYYESYDAKPVSKYQSTNDNVPSRDNKKLPILLLHGGLVAMQAWYSQLPALTKDHPVISVDLRGHGSSTLGSVPLNYRLMANDVVQVLAQLHIVRANIVGWSDGGNVGLLLAVNHQTLVSKLVAISANFHASGLRPGKREEL